MANDTNHVTLIGRTTRDTDLRQIQSGTSIASFSLAVNRSYTTGGGEKKEECSFFNCILWGKQGEAFAKYVKKGHRVLVEGRLQQRTWQDKDGNNRSVVEVVVERFQFLEARHDNQNSGQSAPQNNGKGYGQNGSGQTYPDSYDNAPLPNEAPGSFNDDDIPF